MTAGEGRREKSSIPQTVVLICTRTVHISYLSPAEECEIVWAAWLTQSGPQFSQVLHFRNILNSILKADGYLPGVEGCFRAQLQNTTPPGSWHV